MMKTLKTLSFSILMLLVMASFSQCSSTKELQDRSPTELGQVYFQKWIAGVEGGGSGLNLMIPIKENRMSLDSVYFRGKRAKLEFQEAQMLYIGRFLDNFNKPKDMVMSGDKNAEYGNRVPEIQGKIPFDLKDNECVISFKEEGTMKYFKVEDIVEKEMIPFPSAPPNKQ